MFHDDLSILLRVLIACILCGILGWEREASGKAAGLRTHILVGVASVLFTVVGQFMAISFRVYGDHVRFDAANLVGAIVTGISFLGAGMIIFRKDKMNDVHGLTTAAGIVTTAAIGILIGLERYFLAAGSTAIVFFILRFAIFFEGWFSPNDRKVKDQESEPRAKSKEPEE